MAKEKIKRCFTAYLEGAPRTNLDTDIPIEIVFSRAEYIRLVGGMINRINKDDEVKANADTFKLCVRKPRGGRSESWAIWTPPGENRKKKEK